MIHRDRTTKPAWPAPGFALAVALAAWLGTAPATAQTPAPQPPAAQAPGAQTSPAQKPAPHTTHSGEGGESGQIPTVNGVTERAELFIVGSSSMKAYVDLTLEAMDRAYHLPTPKVHLEGSNKGISEFCEGIGAEFPDIVVSSRAMQKGELEECIENDVLDIIEIRIGQSALYVVTDKGDAVFNVTPRMLYLALASEVPKEGSFVDNPNRTWKQVDRSAPDLPIHVIVPDKSAGTRTLFDAMFMQGGCRGIREIDFIYAASERVHKCTELRDDGVVTQVAEPHGPKMVELLLQAPAGTIAIMAGEIFEPVQDKLDVLPVNGVLPSDEAVNRFDYPMASGNYFYFKRAHMRNNAGYGVVKGIREFMAELTRDELIGANGAFSKVGLIPATPREIQFERRKARTLQPFKK